MRLCIELHRVRGVRRDALCIGAVGKGPGSPAIVIPEGLLYVNASNRPEVEQTGRRSASRTVVHDYD